MTPFHDLQTIRARPGWIVLSARRKDDDARAVLVCAGRDADLGEAQRRLDAIERAHARIDHPLVPKPVARHTLVDRPVLELACDATLDGIEVVRRMARTRTKLPYPAADAFIVSLRQALQAAHAVDHCLGRVSLGNVLFAADGRWSLVGFGANFPVEDEHGVPDGVLPHFQAPEVAIGAGPTPSGDYVALLLMARSLLGHLDPQGPIMRMLHAALQSREPLLGELLQWVERRTITELPGRRATIAEAVAIANRIRDLLGVKLDTEGFQRIIAELLAIEPSRLAEPRSADTLTLGPDAEWVAFGDDEPRPLRGAARRVMLALFEHHQLGASTALRSVDLVELGWPGENPEYESGLNRVYVTMNRLKKQLPDGVIQRFDDGYRLAPGLTLSRAG